MRIHYISGSGEGQYSFDVVLNGQNDAGTGDDAGDNFADATSIEVCKAYRINRHKTFSGLAARGKTTKGWFFGFKLHLVIDPTGELIKVKYLIMMTPAWV